MPQLFQSLSKVDYHELNIPIFRHTNLQMIHKVNQIKRFKSNKINVLRIVLHKINEIFGLMRSIWAHKIQKSFNFNFLLPQILHQLV